MFAVMSCSAVNDLRPAPVVAALGHAHKTGADHGDASSHPGGMAG